MSAVRVLSERLGPIYRIPTHSVVARRGPSRSRSDMVEIDWQGERFAVFATDLDARTAPLDQPKPMLLRMLHLA